MDFPDHIQYLQLQKDLWRTPSSRVAVMVGAGLSLNSRPSPGVSTHFPTWRQLARVFFDHLNPPSPTETEEQKAERERQFIGSSALTLASEYQAVFDRGKLESLLRAAIPDSDHEPGDIHNLLLELPWEDVFTTNYDTLLEGTEVRDRAYQLVTTVNELTFAYRPRIVKLHGSLHPQTQFIITEEDYRSYPNYFALFVNTVRQSLVENTFVLIGFSGDDPNFLDWAGWIRDELGNRHNPIYLVDLLPMSHGRRSLLKQRGITPIDLSPLSAGADPPEEIHSFALKWFLSNLLPTRPQRPERWPDTKTIALATTDSQLSIFNNSEAEPEKVDPFGGSQDTPEDATVIKVMKRWRFERSHYPGWLVPTDEIRSSLWQNTRAWTVRLINAAKDWPPRDRLLLFREINWRLEISMVPIDSGLMIGPFESAIDDLLPILIDEAPPESSTVVTRAPDVSETEVAEAWLEIAFALLREARENYDAKRWESIKEKIDRVVNHYPQYMDRYIYEQALWMMWNLERNDAKNLLATWSPSSQSPLAKMWKAGILAELDRLGEACSLLRSALQEIRNSFRNADRQIRLLSLEGWCTYLLSVMEPAAIWEGISIGDQSEADIHKIPELREEFLERWEELKAWDCDPWPLIGWFDKVLSAERPVPKGEKQVIHGFDPWQRHVSYSLFGGPDTRWLPAFAAIRLIEQAGIPVRFSRDTLKNATEWLTSFDGIYAPSHLISHLIRAGKYKDLKEHRSMKRTRVAGMELDDAKSLNEWAMAALRREFSSLSGPIAFQSAQTALLEVLIEAVSRLTLRLESEGLHEAFCLSLELHKQPEFISHIRLNRACEPWFLRLFQAADDNQLLEWLPDLLQFPLTHANAQSLDPQIFSWPDPIDEFPTDRVRAAKGSYPELLNAMNEATEWLLERAKSESGEARQRAVWRLIRVSLASSMTKEQSKRLGELLWGNAGASCLPDLPGLNFYHFLQLPAPDEVDTVSRIKEHLLTLIPRKSVSVDGGSIKIETPGEREDQMILEVTNASKPVIHLPYELEGHIDWSLTEAIQLWKEVIEWWKNEKSAFEYAQGQPEFFGGFDRYARASTERLGMFLARVILPRMNAASEDDWNRILAFLSQTRQLEVFLTSALPYVLVHRSNERDMVLQMIYDDLSSDNEKAAKAGAKAVRHWIYLADADLVEKPPTAAVDELSRRVVFRRPEGIHACLQQLALLLTEKPDFFSSEQVQLIVSSLTPWSHATCLPLSEEGSREFPEEERPELRVLLGRLASALNVWLINKQPEQPEPSEISTLRKSYSSDPLPEVRRSFNCV